MEQEHELLKHEFRAKIKAAFEVGLEYVRSMIAEKAYIGTHFGWPSISFWDNGMPSISESIGSGPTDYTGAFSQLSGRTAPTFIQFDELADYVLANPFLRQRLLPGGYAPDADVTAEKRDIVKIMVAMIPHQMVDRYMHLYPDVQPTEELLNEIYSPLEEGIFGDKLHGNIVIPILFVRFDFDELEIADRVVIRKLDESMQLARASIKNSVRDVNNPVLAAATHALVLQGWCINNDGAWKVPDVSSEARAYPLETIDTFFGAFRIVTGDPTGYAQLLLKPYNWARRYVADRTPLVGTSLRAYPQWFDNYYWLSKSLPHVTRDTALRIASVFRELQGAEKHSLKVAVRRLNMCFLRDNDEDATIDAAIGLEVLLSEDNQAVTHKLALRVGALARMMPTINRTPSQAFQDIKKTYEYRSAIVHGNSKASKKREIVTETGEKADATQVAIRYLRAVLQVLVQYPRFREPRAIDAELLLGVRDSEPATADSACNFLV